MSQELHRAISDNAEFKTLHEGITQKDIDLIADAAHRIGLDPNPTHFELVPPQIMYELGAYGLPGRFSHWTHGKAYHQQKTMYDYGLSKIYELVINTNPAHGFLNEGNSPIQNKLVVAHVLAHVDFFKHNPAFLPTEKRMDNIAPLRGERIRQYENEHGKKEIEDFLDHVLSIGENIDWPHPNRPDFEEYLTQGRKKVLDEWKGKNKPTTSYDDLFGIGQKKSDSVRIPKIPFPVDEEPDLLWFLPLARRYQGRPFEDWQEDALHIVRSEMVYFSPQAKTKIMNEGWAAYGHARILRLLEEEGKLTDAEGVEWKTLHSGVLSPSRREINPYYVGYKIFENCQRLYEGRPHPDGKKDKDWQGRVIPPEKFAGDFKYDPYWIRANIPSDAALVQAYLTDYLIDDLDLYIYALVDKEWKIIDKDPKSIRAKIVNQLSTLNIPQIVVAPGGADYQGTGALKLIQKMDPQEEQELDLKRAQRTLTHVQALWDKPVCLETEIDGKKKLLSCENGDKTEISDLK